MPVRYLVEVHHPDPGTPSMYNTNGQLMVQAPAAGEIERLVYKRIEYAKERVSLRFRSGYFVRLRKVSLTTDEIRQMGGTMDA